MRGPWQFIGLGPPGAIQLSNHSSSYNANAGKASNGGGVADGDALSLAASASASASASPQPPSSFGGRVVVPGYHAYIRGLDGGGGAGAGVSLPVTQLYNNFALGHTMYSDDGGDTWASEVWGAGSRLGRDGGCGEESWVQKNGRCSSLDRRRMAAFTRASNVCYARSRHQRKRKGWKLCKVHPCTRSTSTCPSLHCTR